MKKALSLIIAATMLVTMMACSKAPETGNNIENSGESKYRDTINIAVDVDAETYTPIYFKNTTATRVGEFIYDGLIRLDETLTSQPALAESWEISDDGIVWTFHLRSDVKFSDGSDFTSADVAYTYDEVRNEANNAPYRTRYTCITEIECPDDYTVVFHLEKPNTALLVYLNMGILPEGALDIENFDSNPIGTGPYKVVSYEMNNVTALKARDDYWAGTPATENINIYVINDNSVRLASLEAGDVDFVSSPLTASDLHLVENNDKLIMNKVPGLGITYLGFNVADDIIGDLAVRQAIAYMVDKQTISDVIYSGMDTPGITPILSFSWASSDKLKDYEYSKDKAVEVLDAAGWLDSDGDGIREKDGKKLEFTLATHTDDTSRFQVVEFMQNQLQSIGMKIDVSVTEWANFSAEMINRTHQVWVAGWLNLLDPDRMYDMFHSSSGTNYGNYGTAETDAALEDARSTDNQTRRAEDYRMVAQYATDDVWYVTMLEQAYVSIHTNKLEGYTVYPSGSFYTLWQSQIAE